MASSWIENRVTSSGQPRFRVRFRPGGRGPGKYGGSYKTKELARARQEAILLELAAMRRRREPKAKKRPVEEAYTAARRLSQQVSLARDTADRGQGRLLRDAEEMMGQVTDLLFEAWRKSGI